jgi:hypothetical protein
MKIEELVQQPLQLTAALVSVLHGLKIEEPNSQRGERALTNAPLLLLVTLTLSLRADLLSRGGEFAVCRYNSPNVFERCLGLGDLCPTVVQSRKSGEARIELPEMDEQVDRERLVSVLVAAEEGHDIGAHLALGQGEVEAREKLRHVG